MGRKIIFATGNAGKMKEVREILKDLDTEVWSMKDIGIDTDIEENGRSFQENAMIKAREVSNLCNELVLADDSGLVIDYLNGEPGIYSARYLGEDTSYTIKNNDLIRRLEKAEGDARSARFICAIAAVFPDGAAHVTEGVIEGRIGYEERGAGGFGYDPIFVVPEYNKTTAELTDEEKNRISHRGKALSAMKDYLNQAWCSPLEEE